MHTKLALSTLVVGILLLGLPGSLPAETISLNFVGNSGTAGTLLPGNVAGMANSQSGTTTFVSNWNNGLGVSGSMRNLMLSSGGGSETSVRWSADEAWQIPSTSGGQNLLVAGGSPGDGLANPTMMKGYIGDTGSSPASATTVSFDGLAPAPGKTSYSVLVYFDGDNGGAWRKGTYRIGSVTLDGEDSEGVNFNSGTEENPNGLFQYPVPGSGGNSQYPTSPNNDEGNVVRFDGLTDSTFTLYAWGGPNSGAPRAPINGIQILDVQSVPEPATMALLGLASASIGGYVRRRRAA